MHNGLCSFQPTFSFSNRVAVGKEDVKSCVYKYQKQLIKNLIDNCTSGSAHSSCIEISLVKEFSVIGQEGRLFEERKF